MNQDFLLKLALFFSCVGTMSLLFILHFYELETISVFDASKLQKDVPVRIVGTVESIRKTNSSTKIVVSSLEKINVVVFDDVEILKYDQIIVEGKVESYNGRTQLIADKIIKK